MLGITRSELHSIDAALETGDTDLVQEAQEIIASILCKDVEVEPVTSYEEKCNLTEEEFAEIEAQESTNE